MEKNDYIEWLVRWFEDKTNTKQLDIQNNFFDNGLLDSFKTLMLVTDIESTLQISLPDSSLSDPRFIHIDGLASILLDCQTKGERCYVE